MPASTLEDILNITKLFVIILLDSQPGSEPVAYQMSCPVPRPLMMMIMSMGHDVSELRPVVHPPGDRWSWTTMVEWYQHGKTPHSSNRALWQAHQQSHIVANQVDLGKGYDGFGLRNSSFTLRTVLQHAVKSYTGLPPLRTSPLKKQCVSRPLDEGIS
jgi:hypothetical protein